MIGKRIKLLRTEQHLSQEELALALKTSNLSISYYEKGSRIPDIDFVVKTAKYFNVTADFLLGISNIRKDMENEKMHQRLFVDMDGTLAIFQPVNQLEILYEKGYFERLIPINSVLQAMKNVIHNVPEIEVFVLSAYLIDSEYALEEKNAWLDHFLPELPRNNRIFLPCGADKKDYIPYGIREDDFLLDDYTYNLNLWEPPARGIKLLNGINHTRGTWEHDRIRFDKSSDEIANNIVGIIRGQINIKDNKPCIQPMVNLPAINNCFHNYDDLDQER